MKIYWKVIFKKNIPVKKRKVFNILESDKDGDPEPNLCWEIFFCFILELTPLISCCNFKTLKVWQEEKLKDAWVKKEKINHNCKVDSKR